MDKKWMTVSVDIKVNGKRYGSAVAEIMLESGVCEVCATHAILDCIKIDATSVPSSGHLPKALKHDENMRKVKQLARKAVK